MGTGNLRIGISLPSDETTYVFLGHRLQWNSTEFRLGWPDSVGPYLGERSWLMYLISSAARRRLWVFVLIAVTAALFSAAALTLREAPLLAQSPGETAPNLKVAFIGDSSTSANARAVLELIRDEGADMVLAQGDLAYDEDNSASPFNWDDQINAVLGPDFPFFASIGNHDIKQWSTYEQLLTDRLARVPDATCTGDYGTRAACTYKGLFFILSGAGTTRDPDQDVFITQQLGLDNSIWRICSWHQLQQAMQVGGKGDDVGWAPYEECRKGRAIVASAHEHSYERTKTLISTELQIVDPSYPEPDLLRVGYGSTFVFVSGVGGKNVRDQERCFPTSYPYGCNGEWASIYTSSQGGKFGALFIEFNVGGDPTKANGYFKNIDGEVIDTFTVVADLTDVSGDPATPPLTTGLVATSDSNSISISWITDKQSTGTVNLGSSPTFLDQSKSSSTLNTSHLAVFQGLTPDTAYYYQVTTCSADNACASSEVDSITTGPFVPLLVISGLTVSSGQVYNVVDGGLGFGAKVYTDRRYSVSSLPPSLEGTTYIQTANTDKSETSEDFVTFFINQDARVYVGYDARALSVPQWMAAWSRIDEFVGTTDIDHDLYMRDFPMGSVTLGANLALGSSGADSNYMIIVEPTAAGGVVNQIPVAALAAAPTSGQAPLLVSFDATASADPDGTIASYAWDFADGSSMSGAAVDHEFLTDGTFLVTLTVTDDIGAAAQASVTISVAAMPTLPTMLSPVNDLDGDGLAEDINGSGRLDFADVVGLFENLESPEVTDNMALFDFDGDGAIGFGDVISLFEELMAT